MTYPMPLHLFRNKKILICVLNFRGVEMQSQDCCIGLDSLGLSILSGA